MAKLYLSHCTTGLDYQLCGMVGRFVAKGKAPDEAANGLSSPLYSNDVSLGLSGGIAVSSSTKTTTTSTTTILHKRTVTKNHRRRASRRAGSTGVAASSPPADAEEVSSELEEEEQEQRETVNLSNEQRESSSSGASHLGGVAINGIGVLHQASITANGALTPTILVDKPLPDFPATSDGTAESVGKAGIVPSIPQPIKPNRDTARALAQNEGQSVSGRKTASVRRVRSFGDLLQTKQASATEVPLIPRCASYNHLDGGTHTPSVTLDVRDAKDLRNAERGLGLGISPGKSRILKKRASSLGLARHGSTDNTAPGGLAKADGVDSVVQQVRVASNATAPPGTLAYLKAAEPDRKRKGSGFAFFSSLLKSKAKEVPSSSPLDTSHSTPSALMDELQVAESSSSSASQAVASRTPLPAQESGGSSSRRYTIFPSFFRSSSMATPGGDALSPQAAAPALSRQTSNATITPPPTSRSPLSNDSAPPLTFLPDLPNAGRETMPQLPSIDRNLGDITFTGLFDFTSGTSSASKKGKRSRASTKSSITSFLASSSSQQGRLRSGSSASQTEAASQQQDYLNCKGDDAGTFGLQRDKTITRSVRGMSQSDPPAAPPVSSANVFEREITVRHRVQRSNSASSAIRSSIVASASSRSSGQTSLSARPSFSRSRSSSTVHSVLAPNGSLRYLAPSESTGQIYSPAVTITGHRGSTEPQPANDLPPADDDFDFSFFANIAARTGPPSSSGYSSSNAPTTPDAYTDDRLDDFGSLPGSSTAIRLSQDSRSNSAGAPSILSTSSPSSTIGKPPSILQKTLRKRANTAGSLLASSMPPSSARGPGSPSSAGVSTVSVMGTRSGRSNSSSRLSSFLTSPTSFLSSSPSGTAISGTGDSPSWFSTREFLSPALDIVATGVARAQSDLCQSPVGSPQQSSEAADTWPSSLPVNGAASTSSLGVTTGRKRSGSTSPAMASTSSLSPTTRYRSGSISAIPSRLSEHSIKVDDNDTPESYVERLKEIVDRNHLATLLAAS